MAANTSKVKIEIEVDAKGGIKAIRQVGDESQTTGKKGKKSFDDMGKSAGSLNSTLLKIGGAAGGLYLLKKGFDAVVAITGTSINRASDLQETVSKSDTIFGANATLMRKWAEGGVAAFGMSKQAALENASTLGNMFSQLGAGSDMAAENSRTMIKLSADLASFHNVAGGANEVLLAMQSSFRGEYDALQRYIPTINAAAVQEHALAMTHKTSAKELTNLEKALAAQVIMMRDAGAAVGDFERTSGGLANQQRILDANIDNIVASIGKDLVPIVEGAYQEFNTWIARNQVFITQDLPKHVKNIGEAARDATVFVRDLSGAMLGLSQGDAIFQETEKQAELIRKIARAEDLRKITEESLSGIGGIITGQTDAYRAELSEINFELAAYNAQLRASKQRQVELMQEEVKARKATLDLGKAHEDAAEALKGHADFAAGLEPEKRKLTDAEKDYAKALEDAAKEDEKFQQAMIGSSGTAAIMEQQLLDIDGVYYHLGRTRQKTADEIIEATKKEAEAARRAYRDQTLAGKDFFAGVRLGHYELLAAQTTWAEAGKQTFEAFAFASKSTVKSVLLDGMRGDLDDFGSYFDSFAARIEDRAASIASEMATNKLFKWGGKLIGESGEEIIDWLLSAQQGAWMVKQDTVAKLHRGDMVVPPGEADVARDFFANLPEYTASMRPDVAEAFKTGAIKDFSGKAVGIASAGGQAGWTAGEILGRVFGADVLTGSIFSGLEKAVMAEYGWTSDYAERGRLAGKFVSRFMPDLGVVTGKLLGAGGAWLGEMVADYFNVREFEGLRDMYEDWGMSRVDAQALARDMTIHQAVSGGGGAPGSVSSLGRSEAHSAMLGGGSGGANFYTKHGGWTTGPEAGYNVIHHGRELTLNEDQVRAVRELNAASGAINRGLLAEIKALRADLRAANYAIARNTQKAAKILDKFDGDGMPAVRS